MPISDEDKVQAIRWKLGIPSSSENHEHLQQVWDQLSRDPRFREQLDGVALSLSGMLRQAIRLQCSASVHEDQEYLIALWDCVRTWVLAEQTKRMPRVAGCIQKGLTRKLATAVPGGAPRPSKPAPPARSPSPAPTVAAAHAANPRPEAKPTMPNPPPPPGSQPPPLPNVPPPLPAATSADSPPMVKSQWKFLPVPDDPDKHDDSAARSLPVPEGFRLIGARVRGKKHKHEGTNCDDWFEFMQSGPWTIIAVSDGAGSKKFSRVGARASCEMAVRELAADLVNHRIEPRPTLEDWNGAFVRTEPDGTFVGADIQQVQQALHRAMRRAFEGVEQAFAERAGKPEYAALLQRPLELNDFSGTLLLAVHTTVAFDGKECSCVMACQIGDGMTGAIHRQGKLVILGEADSGGFSGETEFLTSRNKLTPENLVRKTFQFFGPMQALMVMTDGVADDYFPNDPGLARLHGDLVLNRILALTPPSEEQLAAKASTRLPAVDTFATLFGYDTESGAQQARIRSVEAYAQQLGLALEEVLVNPALLWAGGQGEPLCDLPEPHDRLRVWLDAYTVRGSFDDRSLVVLHREKLLT